ncbi:MAG: hypothetical protein NWF01_03370 [Candidatus Bathyarchaeota archaeon]|nr:hypothetical protein [Candidatus Bathyarchaeota archaeon]
MVNLALTIPTVSDLQIVGMDNTYLVIRKNNAVGAILGSGNCPVSGPAWQIINWTSDYNIPVSGTVTSTDRIYIELKIGSHVLGSATSSPVGADYTLSSPWAFHLHIIFRVAVILTNVWFNVTTATSDSYLNMVFTSSLPNLNYRSSGVTSQIQLAALGSSPLKIRYNDETLDVSVVETDDPDASPIRVRINGELKALKNKTS